jgi:hypothetical protein
MIHIMPLKIGGYDGLAQRPLSQKRRDNRPRRITDVAQIPQGCLPQDASLNQNSADFGILVNAA